MAGCKRDGGQKGRGKSTVSINASETRVTNASGKAAANQIAHIAPVGNAKTPLPIVIVDGIGA